MYSYVHRQNFEYVRMYTWLEELPGVGTYANICHLDIDTDRYIYLHVSIPPALPGLSERYSAPVFQR